jgi:hypothetical protein
MCFVNILRLNVLDSLKADLVHCGDANIVFFLIFNQQEIKTHLY